MIKYLICLLVYGTGCEKPKEPVEIPSVVPQSEIWYYQKDGSKINQDTTKMVIPRPESKIIWYVEPKKHNT